MILQRMTGKLADVWYLHATGRRELGHSDAERAWADMVALPAAHHGRYVLLRHFNAAEWDIPAEHAPIVVEDIERRTGIVGVCHVELHDAAPGRPERTLFRPPPIEA